MADDGEEVIIGLKNDHAFGPVIMFGLGGISVELFKDISFRIAPVKPDEAESMMKQIKSFPLLAGFRGRKQKDIISIMDCIMRVSQLGLDFPEIKELDINPLIVYDKNKGCIAADSRILFGGIK